MADDAALPLPPDKWDRFGVRWSPFWEDGRLMWGSHDREPPMSLTHLELRKRGPFTEKDDRLWLGGRPTMAAGIGDTETLLGRCYHEVLRLTRERDYYMGLVERQQAEIERLRRNLTPGTPEYEALMERATSEVIVELRRWDDLPLALRLIPGDVARNVVENTLAALVGDDRGA